MFSAYEPLELAWIGLCVFLLGMGKGGVPVGAIALPLLLLVWPADAPDVTRDAVGFMLPLLCAMDVVAVTVYRRHIDWSYVRGLLPGSLCGVALGSLLFVQRVPIPEAVLKCGVGVIGILFVLYQVTSRLIARRVQQARFTTRAGWRHGCGAVAGFVSTLAHAAGPVARVYFLSAPLPKMPFAATFAAFFLVLNAVKMPPYIALDMIHLDNLKLAAATAPLIPLGVGTGYVITRYLPGRQYFGLIYVVLLVTSITLIVKSIPH